MFLKKLNAETENGAKYLRKDGKNCLMFFENKNEKSKPINKKMIK